MAGFPNADSLFLCGEKFGHSLLFQRLSKLLAMTKVTVINLQIPPNHEIN
jgi:hypothetical protein